MDTHTDCKRVFHKRELKLSEQSEPLPPSLPLVLPEQFDYDIHTHTLLKKDNIPALSNSLRLINISTKLLKTIDKPIAVILICGPYRTGKSYFLTRLLGSEAESFKLGHSMSACTHGIWMATSVLECEDFVVLLLDTEGLNSVGSSAAESSHVTNLLMITVLLSSTLIYNSRNVPRRSDVKKLSSFVHMSELLLKSESSDTMSEHHSGHIREHIHLPHFIWLLRDVDRIPTNQKGETISLTEYLVQLLKSTQSSSRQSLDNKVSTALFEMFPTIQCKKLPPPSTDKKILANIVKNASSLRPEFNLELKEVMECILQRVQPKRGYNTTTLVDGFVLASMLEQYLVSLNKPGGIPVLNSTWRTAVQLKLTHFSEKLTDEYEKEMKASVCARFPIKDGLDGETGDTLINAHLEIFAKKRLLLQREIHRYLSPSIGNKGEEKSIVLAFDNQIVQYQSEPGIDRVVGGKLLSFARHNHQKSFEHCNALYTREYEAVEKIITTALNKHEAIDISDELKQFKKRYWKQAIGPAKENVFELRRDESSHKESEIFKIPGRPENLRVNASFYDRIKLQWDPPLINSHSVKHYEVYMKPKGEKMILAANRLRCSAVLSNLKNSTLHVFAVRAVSSTCTGKFGPVVCTITDISATAFAITAATVVTLSAGLHVIHLLSSLPEMYETMLKVQDDDDDEINPPEKVQEADRRVQKLEQQLCENIDENVSEFRQKCAVSSHIHDDHDDK